MPAKQLSESDVSIRPLTFLQICQAADHLVSARLAHNTMVRYGPSGVVPTRLLLRNLTLPPTYHWLTSGFGAFYGEQPIGWIFLRGWYQILYVEALATAPDYQQCGVEGVLLSFAEVQARELQRPWIGLTLAVDDAAAIEFYRMRGYVQGHWRIMRRETPFPEASQPARQTQLVPLVGRAAQHAHRRFAMLDLSAADAPEEVYLARFLTRDPYRRPGRDWLVMHQGQPIAYLNQHRYPPPLTIYLASSPDWWGSPQLVDAVCAVLANTGNAASPIDLRLGSSGHHDAAKVAFEQLGFADYPAKSARMFKRIMDSTAQHSAGNGHQLGGVNKHERLDGLYRT